MEARGAPRLGTRGSLSEGKEGEGRGEKDKEGKERKKEGKERKLVIQGSHMVSGTQCPAWSDRVKK